MYIYTNIFLVCKHTNTHRRMQKNTESKTEKLSWSFQVALSISASLVPQGLHYWQPMH